MVGNNLKYLTGVLSSHPFSHMFKKYYSGVELSKSGYQYNKHALKKAPIPKINQENEHIARKIENLVDKILAKKKQGTGVKTEELEKEIDQLVYEIYNFTEEEIKIIEKNK